MLLGKTEFHLSCRLRVDWDCGVAVGVLMSRPKTDLQFHAYPMISWCMKELRDGFTVYPASDFLFPLPPSLCATWKPQSLLATAVIFTLAVYT